MNSRIDLFSPHGTDPEVDVFDRDGTVIERVPAGPLRDHHLMMNRNVR
ncbi:MAG: hypothetical protein ACREWG_04705 [Gammaproteobacteria bacterium]